MVIDTLTKDMGGYEGNLLSLMAGHGREPLNWTLITEFIKQYFIMTVTKHIIVEDPHTLSVK